MLGTELEPMMIQSKILESPIKGERTMTDEQLQYQADLARRHTVEVDYHKVMSTCGDERKRAGLADGSATVEVRPSVFAGSNVYALYIAESTNYFGTGDYTAEERLAQSTRSLKDAQLLSGGHAGCAANAGLKPIMETISRGPEAFRDYARLNMGEQYNDEAMTAAFTNVKKAVESGRYDEWSEAVLPKVLAKEGENPGQAIEILENVPHKARTLIRNKIVGTTVDQNAIHDDSGEDSFVFDDGYAGAIEAAITSGINAVEANLIAQHAREAFLAAVAGAVPNPEINQIDQYL